MNVYPFGKQALPLLFLLLLQVTLKKNADCSICCEVTKSTRMWPSHCTATGTLLLYSLILLIDHTSTNRNLKNDRQRKQEQKTSPNSNKCSLLYCKFMFNYLLFLSTSVKIQINKQYIKRHFKRNSTYQAKRLDI